MTKDKQELDYEMTITLEDFERVKELEADCDQLGNMTVGNFSDGLKEKCRLERKGVRKKVKDILGDISFRDIHDLISDIEYREHKIDYKDMDDRWEYAIEAIDVKRYLNDTNIEKVVKYANELRLEELADLKRELELL